VSGLGPTVGERRGGEAASSSSRPPASLESSGYPRRGRRRASGPSSSTAIHSRDGCCLKLPSGSDQKSSHCPATSHTATQRRDACWKREPVPGQYWKSSTSDCRTTKVCQIDKYRLSLANLFQEANNQSVDRMAQIRQIPNTLLAENIERRIQSKKPVKIDVCPAIYVLYLCIDYLCINF
jgi:hypothetical protein